MRRTLLASAVQTAMLVAAGAAAAQHQGHGHHQNHAAAGTDTRILVRFPSELVDHTLANMRDHLLALQEINEALAKGQNDRASTIAERRLGMTSLQLHGAHEVSKYMPQGMQDVGTTMHRAASRFAIEAQNSDVTGDLRPALGVLGEVMRACVGCHAEYRFK